MIYHVCCKFLFFYSKCLFCSYFGNRYFEDLIFKIYMYSNLYSSLYCFSVSSQFYKSFILQWFNQLLLNLVSPYKSISHHIFCLFLTLFLPLILKLVALRGVIVRQGSWKNIQSYQFCPIEMKDKDYSNRFPMKAKETSQVPGVWHV